MLDDRMARGTAGNPEFRSDRIAAAAENALRHLFGVASGKSFVASSATAAVDAILHSISLDRGTVVCGVDDYPGLVDIARLVCRTRDLEPRLVEGEAVSKAFLEAIDERTRIVLVSQVHWITGRATGFETLAEARRRSDFVLVVDASQGLPIVPIDPDEIGADVIVAAGYKWLAGALGSAAVYISSGMLERLSDRLGEDLWPVVPSTQSYAAMHNLAASIAWMRTLGLDVIRRRTIEAAAAIREFGMSAGWTPVAAGAVQRSGIVSLSCPAGRAERIVERARLDRLHVSARGSAIRLSPHFTASVDECRDAVRLLTEISPTINT
jgi:selenocysteine lyase/cysteine desulfurase